MTVFPPFTWEELTRQLFDLAHNEVRVMIPHLISASRKLSTQAHPALSNTSVFAIAAVLLDGNFRPQLSPALWPTGSVSTGSNPQTITPTLLP